MADYRNVSERSDARNIQHILYVTGPIITAQDDRKKTDAMVHLELISLENASQLMKILTEWRTSLAAVIAQEAE
jgi:hypothetical protein